MPEKPKNEPEKPLTDADVMRGGPGNPEPEGDRRPEDTPPPTRKVRLGGKEYELPEDLAVAVERERDAAAGRRGSELQALREEVRQLRESVNKPRTAEKPEPKGPQRPDPKLMFEDPERFLREQDAYYEALVEQRTAALREQYEQDKQRTLTEAERKAVLQRRLDQFYRDNPELVGFEDLVTLTWNRHYDELKDLSLDEGFDRLKELTHTRIATLTGKVRPKEESDGGRPAAPRLEGSRPRATAAPKKEKEEDKPLSLSAMIRRKQQRHHTGKPAE